MSRPALTALLAVWVAVQVVVAWAPFQLAPPRLVDNAATTIDAGGLAFDGPEAVALAEPPVAWNAVSSLELDLLVRTPDAYQEGPARILSISEDHERANLVVAQDGSDLVIRVRRPGASVQGRPAYRVTAVFADDAWKRIRIEMTDTLEVTVNGTLHIDDPLSGTPFNRWDPGYGLTLGDERGADRAWHGWIMEATLTVDGERQRLLRDIEVAMPDAVWVETERLGAIADVPRGLALARRAPHLVAFAVGGVLAALRGAGGPGYLRTGLAAGAFAALLQVGKIAVAGRHPSLFTIAVQIAGALVGVALIRWRRARRHRRTAIL